MTFFRTLFCMVGGLVLGFLVTGVLDALRKRPVPLILHCPHCWLQHVDRGEWAVRPHREHLCVHCGRLWTPALVHTRGVEALPGRE